MLQSTPMLSQQDSADARACQRATPSSVWTRTEMVNTAPIIAAVARAYTDAYLPADDVTPEAILGPGRTPVVAWARHLCAYLLAEDYGLTTTATAHALGRTNHSTVLNSRARVAAALPRDRLLARALERARAALAGHHYDEDMRTRRDAGRWHAVTTATPTELAEYRYWRLCFLRRGGIQ